MQHGLSLCTITSSPSELEFYKTSPAEVEDSSDESEWEVNDNAEPEANDIEFDVERNALSIVCLLYTSPSPRDKRQSRMPSSA